MPVVVLDQAHWAQLEQVQVQVSHQVKYVSDMDRFGVPDWWEPAAKTGDCEDIALTKRQQLMDMGWPAEALRIAALIDGHGELHAVLTVDVMSLKGKPATYVMDSHFEHVEPWQVLNSYGYYWLERSKPGSSEWARLDGGSVAGTVQIASLSTMIMPASPKWSDTMVQMAQAQAYDPLIAPEQSVAAETQPLRLALDTDAVRLAMDFSSPALAQVQQASLDERQAVLGKRS
jgi:predicted transglutaminase-like cysteine proteinase